MAFPPRPDQFRCSALRLAKAVAAGLVAAVVPLVLFVVAAIVTGTLLASTSRYSPLTAAVWVGWLLACVGVAAFARMWIRRTRDSVVTTWGTVIIGAMVIITPVFVSDVVAWARFTDTGVVRSVTLDREHVHDNLPYDGATSYAYHFHSVDGPSVEGEVDTGERRLGVGATVEVWIDPDDVVRPRLTGDVRAAAPGIVDMGFAALALVIAIGLGVLAGRDQFQRAAS